MDGPQLGDKLEAFYVTLRVASAAIDEAKSGSPNRPGQPTVHEVLYNVGGALFDLETHECLENHSETREVLTEITQDCCKKAAQVLRIVFAENVRVLIAENRKRLVSKAALVVDAEASMNHAQRHVNVLIDLLGNWSNILMSIDSLQLSGACLALIVSPLHMRIIEMAMECFTQFKVDKKLDDWHRKITAQIFTSSASMSKPVLPVEPCNVVALDALLSQISGMREVVAQYYSFLESIHLVDVSISSARATAPSTLLSIVGLDEWSRWRELDAIYISLEHGYLAHTTRAALAQRELLEVEGFNSVIYTHQHPSALSPAEFSGAGGATIAPTTTLPCVLVPQATEDTFYLLQRIAERALLAGSEAAALALGNRIVEQLDPASSSVCDGEESAIFSLVSNKVRYFGCYRQRRLVGGGSGGMQHEAADGAGLAGVKADSFLLPSPPPRDLAVASAQDPQQQQPQQQQQHQQQQQLSSETSTPYSEVSSGSSSGSSAGVLSLQLQQKLSNAVGSEIAEELAAGAEVLADVAQGVNAWLSSVGVGVRLPSVGGGGGSRGVGDRGLSAGEGSAVELGNVLQEQAKLVASGKDAGGASSVELLIAALETDALDTSDGSGGLGGMGLGLGIGAAQALAGRAADRCMGLEDWGVFLSGLAVGPACIARLQALFVPPTSNKLSANNSNSSTFKESNNNNNNQNSGYDNNFQTKNDYNNDNGTHSTTGNSRIVSASASSLSAESRAGMAIIAQELARVGALYQRRLEDECSSLLTNLFERHLQDQLSAALGAGYLIDGAEMERRSGNSELVRVAITFLGGGGSVGTGGTSSVHSASSSATGGAVGSSGAGSGGGGAGDGGTSGNFSAISAPSGGFLETRVRPYCSQAAYGTLLVQLAKLLAEAFVSTILQHCSFTEWGALLLHEETLCVGRALEEAAEQTQQSTKEAFAPLVWALKLLSLNQLADIRYYTIPAVAALDDDTARAILRKRVDFHPDAIAKLKIKFG